VIKIAYIDAETKSKKIGARVTPTQKAAVIKKMHESGFEYESEYVLACCLNGLELRVYSDYQLQLLEHGKNDRLDVRVMPKEKEIIIKRFKESNMNNFSRYVRNCCLNNPIITINELKEFTVELNRIGNNLNQLTMLCHQGLISAPDLSETKEALKNTYKEVIGIKKKYILKR
jgi:hypothetical protein